MSVIREDNITGRFKQLGRHYGVEVIELNLEDIKPSHSVRLKCAVPLCEYYGICKVCPPNIPGVDEFKAALEDYSRAFLVVFRERIENLDRYRSDFTAEMKLSQAVSELELEAFRGGYCQAMGLIVGGCKLCPECTPPGQPCRHPFKARPSPEGFGIDLTKLAREAGVPLEWPPVEHVCFLGLVLI